MSKIDPCLLETAFVPVGTAMLSEVMERIAADEDLPATRRRDMLSGLRKVARALARPATDVPADPRWLQPRLARVAPAALGISPKTWANAVSDARAGLAHVGLVAARETGPLELSGPWAPLFAMLDDIDDARHIAPLRPFIRFLDRIGVSPDEVNDVHVAAYREALALNEIRRNPLHAAQAAVIGWRRAQTHLPDWPRQYLVKPGERERISLPLEAFPAGFGRDLDAWIATMSAPDELDPDALLAPLSDATIRHRTGQMRRFASALVHDGVPIDTVDSLEALVRDGHAARGLRWFLSRNGGNKSAAIADIAIMLKALGKRYLRVAANVQVELDRLAKRLELPRQEGLTQKNQERLRPFDEREILREFLAMPQRLLEDARKAPNCPKRLRDAEVAVAIAVLQYHPVRIKNLSRLHLEHNLQRPGNGRVYLVFETGEVKNGRLLEYEVPPKVLGMIDTLLEMRTPLLCPPGTPWLFPRRDGTGPMHTVRLGQRISDLIIREIGHRANPHLFRHISARLLLKKRPGAYELVRRLLGHKSLSSVTNAYTGFETDVAAQIHATNIENELQRENEREGGTRRPQKGKKRRAAGKRHRGHQCPRD